MNTDIYSDKYKFVGTEPPLASSSGGFNMGLLGLVSTLASAGANVYGMIQQNKANEYQKELNETMMQREDNAVQRRLADVQAAGFSPLVAANLGGAGVGSFTGLTPVSGDALASTIQTGAQNISQNALARRQAHLAERVQYHQEKMYKEAEQDRANESKIKAVEAAKAALDLQHYAKEKNLSIDSQELANNLSRKSLEHADSLYEDTLKNSASSRAVQDSQKKYTDAQTASVKQSTQELKDSWQYRLKQIRENTVTEDQNTNGYRTAADVEKSLRMAMRDAGLNANKEFYRLDDWAKHQYKENGKDKYSSYHEWLMDNLLKTQNFDKIMSITGAVINGVSAVGSFYKK